MRNIVLSIALLAFGLGIGSCTSESPGHSSRDHDMSHMSRHAGVNERGDRVMGFDHDKTTHRFRLLPDGGSIEVTANDDTDVSSRDKIREHLGHIAKLFSSGNFEAPMLIHGREPAGVPTMKRLISDINFRYEEIDKGGRVCISTAKPDAVAAIHEFLRFQIEDHKTGDPTEVEKN